MGPGPRVAWIHQPHTELWDRVMPRGRAAAGRVFERDLAPRLYRSTPVVTLSESVRRLLVERFHLRPERVHVVPPGVDDRFRPNPGAKEPEPLLVAVGRLTASKEFDRVIRVVARLRERAPAARLVIAGSGTERDRLASLVAGLGAEDWCELAGRIDDNALAALYQRAWALVSASSAEGWGITITEAAACGTPSVVSDIAGHADGETGHLAARDDDFIDALERLIGHRGHRERLGEAARARAARLTWERTAHDTLAVLAGDVRRRSR